MKTQADARTRRFVLTVLAAFAGLWPGISLAGAGGGNAPGDPKWNVLLIVSDDLNNNLGCYGHPVVKSPNLDRLAERGVRFERAYCNYPVCNPSRASFMSGRRPDTTRVLDNVTPTRTTLRDAVMLPEQFRRSGYRTLKVGKIFHTGDAFEDPRSWDLDIREEDAAKNPPAAQILRQTGRRGIVLRAKDEETWDGFVARKAADLMEQTVAEGRPFFVAAGFRRPHAPYIAPEKYHALYDPSKLKPRVGPPGHVANIPAMALTYRMGDPAMDMDKAGETIAAYYASISFMDAQVGVLLAAMDRMKLWDRTVVVFVSDHGYHLGEHGGLWHKMTLFEEAAGTPMIVVNPGVPSGVTCSRIVELVDVYPTLAELCGLAAPPLLEGTSFVPLLKDPRRPWKKAAFTVVARPRAGASGPTDAIIANRADPNWLGRTLRTERWRYTEWPDGSAELYDHSRDPYEYENLATAPSSARTRAEMKQLLARGWKSARP